MIAVVTMAVAAVAVAPIEERLTSTDPTIRDAAIAQVLARPDAVSPFLYAALVQALWSAGRRQQAAFWFYVFQARTRPWADADTRGDGEGALRASLNQGLGSTVNGWLGSDLAAWKELARRAIAYEAHFPLSAERPKGVSADRWRMMVAEARATYADGFAKTLEKVDPAEHARARRGNGLAVGPLDAPGPALLEGWR